jgi:hypothetical protein
MLLRRTLPLMLALASLTSRAGAAELPKVRNVELQPLAAQVGRLLDALDFLGAPVGAADAAALRAAAGSKDRAAAIDEIQNILDKHCLAGVRITSRDKIETFAGPRQPELAEQGWRVFLVKVHNPAGVSELELRAESPSSIPLSVPSSGKPDPKVVSVGEVSKRFMEVNMFTSQPLTRYLSGLELEYRILQIYSRDAGRREASLGFSLWRPTAAKPGRQRTTASNEVAYLFECAPAVLVRLEVHDSDGKPTTAAFTIKDGQGRVYPSMSRRLAPDFPFQPQVYRASGETVTLQPGTYQVAYTRGPEYLSLRREIQVPSASSHTERFELQRWVHPAASGWYSGDHHVHAAGCAHYESPTEGVTPQDMIRHVLGEDLDVGCCLSWGPCWYHQKRYFEGKTNRLSTVDHLLRYDVEVSGFPSSHCGHVCLLRLREQDYPGTKLIEDWPSWDLPILRWAKSQNAVVGFAHSGSGLDVGPIKELPNYVIPPMSGIGANEYLVDVAHDSCDFISTVDTPPVWELNIWYHTLNCGYRCRISGETDFPCIYGERVGLGRSYVHVDGSLNFDEWAEGIRRGRSYVSDGKSHLMDFRVNDAQVGVGKSEVNLSGPSSVKVSARVAAFLEPETNEATERIRQAPLHAKPYWDVERARIGNTRRIPVELVVNGRAVDQKEIVADESEQTVTFEVPIQDSSWVCLRVFPSSHTNPVFVLVGGKPIRVSKRSAEWCLKGIDKCWQQKERNIRKGKEHEDARLAYEEARRKYRQILGECAND